MNNVENKKIELTVLCKVVDNFGDIGVVWRMCQKLKQQGAVINLVVDDLISFNKICDSVDSNVQFQIVKEIAVYKWDSYDFCLSSFSENDGEKLSVILECFQCGRPDWMEYLLFEQKLNRTVQVIMIDYLTAEKYAEDFHCLDSLTRSAKVRKVNFMPGFTEKTGGLIIDDVWMKLPERNPKGNILIFTYERDWKPLVKALDEYSNVKDDKITVSVAQGRGFESFKDSFENLNPENLTLNKLDFMNQDDWDEMMRNCSVLFIRGEESMSRACLSGIPFVWHAYPQSDEYQLVKVNALLDRMSRHFSESDFEIIKSVWLDFNQNENDISDDKLEKDCLNFLQASESLVYGFKAFAESLQKNGDLCSNLMTFIQKVIIMN